MHLNTLLDLRNTTLFLLSDKPRVAWCYLLTSKCNHKIVVELQEQQIPSGEKNFDEEGLLYSLPPRLIATISRFVLIHKCGVTSCLAVCELGPETTSSTTN